jgi:hypothetical protein
MFEIKGMRFRGDREGWRGHREEGGGGKGVFPLGFSQEAKKSFWRRSRGGIGDGGRRSWRGRDRSHNDGCGGLRFVQPGQKGEVRRNPLFSTAGLSFEAYHIASVAGTMAMHSFL